MQRYGAFLWSGDVYSTWETLKTHVPVAINTGLSGIPFWGTDIGGFVPTPSTPASCTCAGFSSARSARSFRAHGRTWHLRLPWGWNTGEVGPSEIRGYTGGAADPDPSELHNAAVEPIVQEVSRAALPAAARTPTRSRASAAETGLPMMRALWLHHPDDPQAVARGDQYSVGPRHPRVAGRREGRDVAAPVSAARRLVRFLDRGDASTAAARSIARSISRRCRCTCAPARSCRWDRSSSTSTKPVDEPADARRLSRRRRRVHAVRRRRAVVRLSARGLDGDRDAVADAPQRLSLRLAPARACCRPSRPGRGCSVARSARTT